MTEKHKSTQEIWKRDRNGTMTRKYSISEYESLPDGKLHGIHTLSTYTDNEHTVNVETKLFDEGSFVKIISNENINANTLIK
jgi:hypothetical protein